MATLDSLRAACGVDNAGLAKDTQTHIALWESWLRPISETPPAGDDPGYDDNFQRMREEVNKLSGIDTGLICALSENVLTQVSKDIRTATFYLWARLHRDGEAGLAEGLELLAGLMQRFGAQLHPQRGRSRKAALEWLGSSRMLDSLSLYPEVELTTLQRIAGALTLIEQATEQEEDGARPQFSPLYQALENRLAQCGGAGSVVPQNSREESPPGAQASSASLPSMAAVTSGRDLLDQAKLLAGFLRDQPEGWLAGHHMMKSVRWDTLTQLPPLDASGRTRLMPPKPESRAHLKRLYLQQSWLELREQTDSLFSQGINHLWLDVQWYTWQALLKTDNDTVRADIIRQDLKGLLNRMPGLEGLAFNDGTPFADEVTRNWITQHILDNLSGWQADPVSTTTTLDSDILALEPEALEKADNESVEAALNWLQTRSTNVTARDRWLMRLVMARVSEQHGKPEMALHLLGELDSGAQHITLQQWSPDLLFEVKARRLKLLRMKAARSETEKHRLQPDMDTLLNGLIAIDPARAAVLCA